MLNRMSPPETRQAELKMEEAKAKEGSSTCAKADNTLEILAAINSLRTEVTTQNDELLAAISEIQTDLSSYSGRLTEAEERIGETEENMMALQQKVHGTDKLVTTLKEKIDDFENRHRRSNLRIMGAEGREVETFLEKWIPEVLGAENFPAPVIIETAHRIPSGRPKHNSPPARRPLILKFLNYSDKVHMMRAARPKGKIMYGEQHVMFFPKFSVEVTRKRMRYSAVKQ